MSTPTTLPRMLVPDADLDPTTGKPWTFDSPTRTHGTDSNIDIQAGAAKAEEEEATEVTAAQAAPLPAPFSYPLVDPTALVRLLMVASSNAGTSAGPLHDVPRNGEAVAAAAAFVATHAASASAAGERVSSSPPWAATAATVESWDGDTLVHMVSVARVQLDMLVTDLEVQARDLNLELVAARIGGAFCHAWLQPTTAAEDDDDRRATCVDADMKQAIQAASTRVNTHRSQQSRRGRMEWFRATARAFIRTQARLAVAKASLADAIMLEALYTSNALGPTAAVEAVRNMATSARVRGQHFLFMAPLESRAAAAAAAAAAALASPPITPLLSETTDPLRGLLRRAIRIVLSAPDRNTLFRALLAVAAVATRSTAYLTLAADFAHVAVDASSEAAITAQVGLADVMGIRVRPSSVLSVPSF